MNPMKHNLNDISKIGCATKGATLFELLIILAWFGCIITGAKFCCNKVGGPHCWLFGGLVGGVVGFLALLGIAGIKQLLFEGIPHYPMCCNGCIPKAYSVRKCDTGYCLVCACGVHYRKHGRRFLIVNDDGTETPYLVWVPLFGWKRDVTV